jgi:hypothetical protein
MNGRSSANGSSELVLHLRTVHFSLLLACFIALFSVVAGSPGVVNVAHGQLQNLLAIKEQWQSWPIRFATEELTWLQDNNAPLKSKAITARNTLYVTRAELQRLGIDSATYWNLSIQPAAFYFFSYAGSPLDFLMRKNQPYKPPQTLAYWRDSEFVVGAQSPATLLDMQEFWDGASDIGISVIEDISAQIQIVSGSSVVGSVRWQEQRPPPELSSYGSTLQPHGFLITQENCGARPWYEKIKAETDRETRTVLCGKMTDTLVQPVFSVIQRRYVVRRSLRLWLASEFSFDSDGSVFERSFSELYAVASRYRLIALEDIDAILSAEIERTGERVEILGLRLPEAALSNWGIGIIVTIQIYFLLHLQILGTRLKVRHPPRSGWLDELGRLKGGR